MNDQNIDDRLNMLVKLLIRKEMKPLKLVLLILGGLLSSVILYAQDEPDRSPVFVGGNFTDYATWYMDYPAPLLRANAPGKAFCYLSVDSIGNVRSKWIKASHPLFENEARRLIYYACFWEPARKDGRFVASDTVVYISFDPATYRHRLAWQEQKLVACQKQVFDSEPVFPDDIRRIVMGNMKWPDNAGADTATVVCRFTVTSSGLVENVWVEKGRHRKFNKEAMCIVKNFPELVPALKSGKTVPFDYRLTIHFWKDDYDWYRRPLNRERNNVFVGGSEVMPEFPGGQTALVNFIKSHVKITPEIKENGRKGRVTCSFAVKPDGTIDDLRVVRGLHPLQDAEALRVLKLMPRWKSGSMYGGDAKPYRVFCRVVYTIPVWFDW